MIAWDKRESSLREHLWDKAESGCWGWEKIYREAAFVGLIPTNITLKSFRDALYRKGWRSFRRVISWKEIIPKIKTIVKKHQPASWKALYQILRNKGILLENISLAVLRRRCADYNLSLTKMTVPVGEEEETQVEAVNILLDENLRVRKALEKEQARTQIVLQTIKKAILTSGLIPAPSHIPTVSEKKFELDPEDAGLLLGDWHYGAKYTLEDTVGLGEYNKDVAIERMHNLRYAVTKIYKYHTQRQSIPLLHIFGVGDLVEGENIFVGQSHYIDMYLLEQMFQAAKILAYDVIAPWAQVFPEVRLYGVLGNHGRPGKKGHHHMLTNLDIVIYKIIGLLLQNYKNITIVTSKSHLLGMEIKKHLFLLNHGDEIRRWMNIPFYGYDRAIRRWIATFRRVWDYIFIGHHHQKCEFDVAYSEAFINGSFVGAAEYPVRTLMEAGTPKQLYFGIHERQGMSWRYQLKLGGTRGLENVEPDALGILTPNDGGRFDG